MVEMEFNNVRKMASPKQMVMKSLFIAISIYVVTSQVTGDVFKDEKIRRACFGAAGLICTNNTVGCNDKDKVLLINDVVYRGTETDACVGVSDCNLFDSENICCNQEEDVTLHNDSLDSHTLKIYKTCSGQQFCQVNVPDIRLKAGKVTSTTVKYHCIKNQSIINYCENIIQSNEIVHIMYNGQQSDFLNNECYCSIHGDSGIDLYSVDIRLQKQDSTSPQCTDTTLKWGYDQTKKVEECIHSGDNSTLRKLNTSKNIKDMWVQVSIQDEQPTMVWIAAKATSGKVNVTCRQRNVNTKGTTTTLTVMLPTIDTTAQLYESSTNTTVVVIGPHSQNTAREDETNIGATVGPVVGTILLVVLVVIGVIVKRRRACEICSKKKGDTDDQSYENVLPTIQLSGISNVAHAYENTPGTVQNYEKLQPSMDTNEYQSIGTIDQQKLDQDNAAYVNQGENNSKMVLEMSGGDGDRNNEQQNYYSSIQDDNKVSHGADDGEYYNTKDRGSYQGANNVNDLHMSGPI